MKDIVLREEILAVYAILSVLILFFLYYYLINRKVIFNLLRRSFTTFVSPESIEFFSAKITGILLLGFIPFVIFVSILSLLPSKVGFMEGKTIQIWYLIVILIIITVVISFFSSKNPKIQEISPELRIKIWYPRHILMSSLCWLFYIFGYEFFFRGILWFLCYSAFGFWGALIMNVVLYSLVHIPKGIITTFGAIPLGIIFCILSSYTGSFFPAFAIHAIMAIVTEIFSVYNNPEFHFSSENITK